MVTGLRLLVGLLPASRAKNFLLRMLGLTVDGEAAIGCILLLGVTEFSCGRNARIDSFNIFRRLAVEIHSEAEIGSFNWFSAAPFLVRASPEQLAGKIVVGTAASITSRHYFDASGGIAVGEFVTIAGVRSIFMSHAIDVVENLMTTRTITVAPFSMIGSNSSLLLGAHVPSHSIVAMGSLVRPGLEETHVLYAGVPATLRRRGLTGRYFERRTGPVPAEDNRL